MKIILVLLLSFNALASDFFPEKNLLRTCSLSEEAENDYKMFLDPSNPAGIFLSIGAGEDEQPFFCEKNEADFGEQIFACYDYVYGTLGLYIDTGAITLGSLSNYDFWLANEDGLVTGRKQTLSCIE